MDLKTLGNIALGEVFKIGICVALLVAIQMCFNAAGIGGMGLAATIHAIAILLSNWYSVSLDNGVKFGPDSEGNAKGKQILIVGFVRAGVCVGLFLTGLLIWFVIGLANGVNFTSANVKNPELYAHKLAGNNQFIKALLLATSHMTLFSFSRMWVNLYEVGLELYREYFGGSK